MKQLSTLSIAVRAALPNQVRSNTIACARGGKWRASQVMIDYVSSVRDEMPLHRFIALYQGNKLLPHQKSLLDMIEKSLKNGESLSMIPVRMSGRGFGGGLIGPNF